MWMYSLARCEVSRVNCPERTSIIHSLNVYHARIMKGSSILKLPKPGIIDHWIRYSVNCYFEIIGFLCADYFLWNLLAWGTRRIGTCHVVSELVAWLYSCDDILR